MAVAHPTVDKGKSTKRANAIIVDIYRPLYPIPKVKTRSRKIRIQKSEFSSQNTGRALQNSYLYNVGAGFKPAPTPLPLEGGV